MGWLFKSKREKIRDKIKFIDSIRIRLEEVFVSLGEINRSSQSSNSLEQLRSNSIELINTLIKNIRVSGWKELFNSNILMSEGFNVNSALIPDSKKWDNPQNYAIVLEARKLQLNNNIMVLGEVISNTLKELDDALSGRNSLLGGLIYKRRSRSMSSKKKLIGAAILGAMALGTAKNIVERHITGSPAAVATVAPTRDFIIGGKTYKLKERTVYIAVDKKSALTLLLGPSGSEEQLAKLRKDIYLRVVGAGHLSILYLDPNTKNLMVSEQIGTTKNYPIEKSEVGKSTKFKAQGIDIYEAPGADFNSVLRAIRETGKSPSKFGIGQTCTSHVEDILNAGGLDLANKYVAVPMKGVMEGNKAEENTLMLYLNTFAPSLSKGFKFVVAIFEGKSQKDLKFKDFKEYAVGGINTYSELHNALVKFYNAFPYLAGMEVMIPHTPPGLVLTGLTTGYLKPVHPSVAFIAAR